MRAATMNATSPVVWPGCAMATPASSAFQKPKAGRVKAKPVQPIVRESSSGEASGWSSAGAVSPPHGAIFIGGQWPGTAAGQAPHQQDSWQGRRIGLWFRPESHPEARRSDGCFFQTTSETELGWRNPWTRQTLSSYSCATWRSDLTSETAKIRFCSCNNLV
ncbi:unnamed protein product [Ectocarpus sp. CCAP 1310/34]|nr:unnamed protein product [Ectocarpus sp. CCAP 1310/34]